MEKKIRRIEIQENFRNMKNKQTEITDEKVPNVPNLHLNLDFEDLNFINHEFIQKLKWYEDEFDELFGSKTHYFTLEEINLANEILDQLSETINEYRNENFLLELMSTLNNIEKKHPELF